MSTRSKTRSQVFSHLLPLNVLLLLNHWSQKKPGMRCSNNGDHEENRGDEFEFSASKENINQMTREQKKKSAVWFEVSEVISKMVEENGYFRNRLVSYCHFSSEGRDINQNLQSEISCTETDEAIFGWV
ncbi:uncharacterized protein PHA67_007466 [Liasis olivaceus]